eukprot:11469252-Alexandrium_andersonii.AAC.1
MHSAIVDRRTGGSTAYIQLGMPSAPSGPLRLQPGAGDENVKGIANDGAPICLSTGFESGTVNTSSLE